MKKRGMYIAPDARRVELWPQIKDDDDPWFGVVLEERNGQLLVRITDAPMDELVGQTRVMRPGDVRDVTQAKRGS